MAVQFDENKKKNMYLSKEETLGLPAVYIDGMRVSYFHYLVEFYFGSGDVNYERYFHFIKEGNTLHVREYVEERDSIWWWDAETKISRTFYYEFAINPSSREKPFVKMSSVSETEYGA